MKALPRKEKARRFSTPGPRSIVQSAQAGYRRRWNAKLRNSDTAIRENREIAVQLGHTGHPLSAGGRDD